VVEVRVTAILLTIGLAMFVLCAFTLVVADPELGEAAASRFGMGSVFMWAWSILQWPLAFVLVTLAIRLVYYFAPGRGAGLGVDHPRERSWRGSCWYGRGRHNS